jgi:predicted aldo/keto reductase-like oxidoreductase
MISAVGFGTNELRLVPEKQAIDTLLRGFDLGVNIIHTAPDYEGAEEIVAKAVARAGRKIIVASNAYDVHYNATGRVHHFEELFEATCARLRTDRLDLYGIAAVDDREAFQENVWGKNGMVEFLLRMKEEGRIGSIFCTNHGEPRHMRKLIESGVFDAMMISLNPLGYHLLTLHPPPGRHFEDAGANWREIAPLCREHDVGVMAMMPLAGGLLVDSRAFPRRQRLAPLSSQLTASDVLRSILQDQNIACVLPGTASLDEAEENARAGHQPITVPAETRSALAQRVMELYGSLCSRCGACEDLCSQSLPISWLFRAGEMAMQPAETFETWSDVDYFRLHPSLAPSCASCANVTCACPHGIDIPRSLIAVHDSMVLLLERGLIAPPPGDVSADRGDATFGARVIRLDIPESIRPGEAYIGRLQLENIGTRSWFPEGENGAVVVSVFLDGIQSTTASFRQVVHPGGRGHIVFELDVPRRVHQVDLRLQMLAAQQDSAQNAGFEVFRERIPVICRPQIADGAGATGSRGSLRATGRRRLLQTSQKKDAGVSPPVQVKLVTLRMALGRTARDLIAKTSVWLKTTL